MNYEDITTLAIALGLGLLVGMQREKTGNKLAGVRTFSLLAILGVFSGFLTRDFDNPFILPALGLAIAAFLVAGNVLKRNAAEPDLGQTTEVAALLMFSIGAYLVMGDQTIGVIVGGLMAVLLYAKEKMHNAIDRLKDKDLSAIMTFAGISLVILPILPNETYGPLDVINPQNIWLMVTLIVGISVIGYFIYKFLGKKVGLLSNSILGGLISSTATTVSYAKKTKDAADIDKLSAFVIVGASAIALVRIVIEMGVVIPERLPEIIAPIAIEFVVIVLLCVFLFYRIQKGKKEDKMPEPKNPAQLKTAIVFGLLYGVILLAVAFVNEEFENEALYVVAIISGLTDVDAITLSLSQIMKQGSLETDTGWRLILLASLSNLFFKGILAATLGTKQLAKWVGIAFGICITAGLLIIWLWP
ncbi:MAG: MgtC/SapB family protein [Flavobacteriaceae bacterium]